MSATDLTTLKSVKRLEIERIGEGAGTLEDVVATEEPLEIRLAYSRPDGGRAEQSISVSMRTPVTTESLPQAFFTPRVSSGVRMMSSRLLPVGRRRRAG